MAIDSQHLTSEALPIQWRQELGGTTALNSLPGIRLRRLSYVAAALAASLMIGILTGSSGGSGSPQFRQASGDSGWETAHFLYCVPSGLGFPICYPVYPVDWATWGHVEGLLAYPRFQQTYFDHSVAVDRFPSLPFHDQLAFTAGTEVYSYLNLDTVITNANYLECHQVFYDIATIELHCLSTHEGDNTIGFTAPLTYKTTGIITSTSGDNLLSGFDSTEIGYTPVDN